MVTYGHHGTDQCRDNITRHHAYLLQYHIAYFFFHVGLGPTCHVGLGHVGTWSKTHVEKEVSDMVLKYLYSKSPTLIVMSLDEKKILSGYDTTV
jgi:hypothetical protein